jgi:putative ABC transport system ATP-binding protein
MRTGTGGAAVLAQVVRGQRRDLALGAGLLALQQGAMGLVPALVGAIVDRAIEPGNGSALVVGLVAFAALYAVIALAFQAGMTRYEQALLDGEHALRVAIARRVLDPAGGAGGRAPGELLSVATSDARRAAGICTVVGIGATIVMAVAVATAVLLSASVLLGLVVLLGTPALLVALRPVARPLARRAAEEQARIAAAASLATDLVRGLRVVAGIGARAAGTARYRAASRSALDATLRAAGAQGGYEGAVTATTGILLVLVALIGGRLAVEGKLGVGDLIAALGITQYLYGPLHRLARVGAELARARASAARIAAVLDAPPAVDATGTRTPALPVRGALSLRCVHFEGLDGLDLEIGPGAITGVVASRPEDARALARLLRRDGDPERGALALDGVPFPALALAALRAAVLVAPHDAELFGATLGEHLGGAAPPPGADVLAAAAVDGVVAGMPDGLAQVTTEGGRSLSGGERQRVALARALRTAAPVLVLHDPTTAVDAATEQRIAARLRGVRAGRTTVLLTSSPALLAACDRVVLLGAGRVAATGTHAALLHDAAAYRAVLA